MVNANISIMR